MMAKTAEPSLFVRPLRHVCWRAWGLWSCWWVCCLSLCVLPCRAARAQTPAHPTPPPYQSLRFEEDYSFLRDPAQRTDLWDPLKYLALRDTEAWYVSLGEEARFDQGSAHEVRHTLGLRLWGRPGPWDYNVEVVYQLGTFGAGQIHAWTAASDTGYTLRSMAWQPRLGLKADIISGDRNPRT